MKIFLTGGTGFIGSNFINAAIQEGNKIVALKRSEKSVPRVPLKGEVQWLIKSMTEIEVEDFKDIDVVVHLAAHSTNPPYDSLINCIQYNVVEPLQLLEVARKAGIRKFVIAGSSFEYGKSGVKFEFIPTDAPLLPTQCYAASKAMSSIAFSEFATQYNLELSYHRIFQVFGEGEAENRLWPSIKSAAQSGRDFDMTLGEQIRDFISVKDVAHSLLNACKMSGIQAGVPKLFNLGSGIPMSIFEFTEYWWNFWGAKGKLNVGKLPYREGEVMRYVPLIKTNMPKIVKYNRSSKSYATTF